MKTCNIIFHNTKILKLRISKYLFFSLLFSNFFIKVSSQEKYVDDKTAFLDSISNNPSGMIYIFDEKEISERSMYEKAINGELSNYSGEMYIKSKDAILIFGERYRYGVMFWVSNNKKENEEED